MVVSSCGRDKGSLLAVLQAEDGCLWVADGKKRPLQRPKRKNLRHVFPTGLTADEASMATNRELRRTLRAMKEALSSNGTPGA